MTVKIKSLEISAFRGIKKTFFDLNSKSLLIFGENGTGKSSIVNALEFLFTNKINSLENAQELSLSKHAHHVNSKKENLKIKITFNDDTEIVKTMNNIDSVNHAEINSYMDEMKNGSFLLTRNKILEFVTTKPMGRYNAFGNIIGLDKLDDIEKTFKKANDKFKKNLNEKIEEKQNKINNSSETLGKFFNMEYDNSQKKLFEILNEILEKKDSPLIQTSEDINEILEKIVIYESEISKTNYNDIITVIDSFKIDSKFKNNLNDIKTFEEKIKKYNNVDDDLIQLLQKSLDFINGKQITKCPVCENEIEINELSISLNNKLKEHETYIKIKKDLENTENDSIAKINDIKQALDIIIQKIENLPEFDNFFKGFNKISQKFDKYLGKNNINFEVFDLLNQIEEKIESLKDFTQSKFKGIEEEKNKKILEELNYIKQGLAEYYEIEKISQKILKLNVNFELSNHVYENFKKTKKEAIEKILNDTLQEINNFYSYIHDGDKISDVNFFQKETSNGILIKINMDDKEEDPRAFSSEGHLDTLGLCIFLAFIKVFHKNCSLIVLDDIVSTVDIPHREKIARLLFENFQDKQFIITTPDKYGMIK
jgi:DNA repair exonuclease SbcCD ATPase subunit